MCQQQQFDMSSQIEVLFENGMPRKVGKSVEKTLQKRAAKAAQARARAEALSANNNNNIRCTNCLECGGCSNPLSSLNNPCVCSSNSLSSASSTSSLCSGGAPSSSTHHTDEEDEMSYELIQSIATSNGSSHDQEESKDLHHTTSSLSSSRTDTSDDSDESLVDSDTGFRSSSRKSNRSGCPMAALMANRSIEASESQSLPQFASRKTSFVAVSTSTSEHTYRGDILAVFTQLTRQFFFKINQFTSKVQKSKTYRVLSKSTQPAHVIAVGILSFVLLAVWPNLLENEEAALNSNKRRSGLALVAYLGAFATHFGAQIWMTFVSGLSLYFALPRHTFGLCQQILFPKYFAMNSMLSILTLILFIKVIAGRWEFSSYVQVIALTICAVIEVAVRLYLAPPLLRLMREKHKFEITIGSGQEVGTLEQGDLVKCPHYQAIHKAFRRIHMTVAMGNLTALVCTFLHLHYLASKISVG